MQNINNKGLSTITSIMIVIVLSMSLAVAFGIIVTTFTKASLSPISCTEWQLTSPFSFDACYNAQTHDVEITLSQKINSPEIDSIDFTLVSQDSEPDIWTCSSQCGDCELLSPGDTKKYYFAIENYSPDSSLALKLGGCTLASQKLQACL